MHALTLADRTPLRMNRTRSCALWDRARARIDWQFECFQQAVHQKQCKKLQEVAEKAGGAAAAAGGGGFHRKTPIVFGFKVFPEHVSEPGRLERSVCPSQLESVTN